jgi:hypothetical protein
VARRVRAKPHQHKRLPKFRHSTGSDETHGAANEGAISNGQTQNVNLDCTLANQCRLAKPKIIAGSGVLARAKLLKANYDSGPSIPVRSCREIGCCRSTTRVTSRAVSV